mmetsp:Transcript_4513/g.12554  ORF Transcript_4513/g.12554 Transcript_4513/m.12554 type:complete len:365 (-) Transcript_4513:136-1230(-)
MMDGLLSPRCNLKNLIVLLIYLLVCMVHLMQFECTFPRPPGPQQSSKLRCLQRDPPAFTLRASLAHWTGPLNVKAVEAWIIFYQKRWGLTDVDLYVPWDLVKEMVELFGDNEGSRSCGGVKIVVIGHFLPKASTNYQFVVRSLQEHVIATSLLHARRDSNDFLMNFDPDEFLESDDFDDLPSMFGNDNSISAVTVPSFLVNFDICSSHNLTFGSLGYHVPKPHGSTYVDNAAKGYYTNVKVACGGQRKYIVRPDHWTKLAHIHDPLSCLRGNATLDFVIDMTGRKEDKQHVRLMHLRTGSSISSVVVPTACHYVNSCKFLNYQGQCVDTQREADFVLSHTRMQEILSSFPLFEDTDKFERTAVY